MSLAITGSGDGSGDVVVMRLVVWCGGGCLTPSNGRSKKRKKGNI